MSSLLQVDELITGGIYAIHSRNLVVGVYDGEQGFIGIREKFGAEYLFTEYLSRRCGGTEIGVDTVRPERLLGEIPSNIPLRPHIGLECKSCGGRAWDTGEPYPHNHDCDGHCGERASVYIAKNDALFKVLKPLTEREEKRIVEDQRRMFSRHAKPNTRRQ